jgi:hypothetical protein
LVDLSSKHPWVLDTDPLYATQEIVLHGYFSEHDPPTLTDAGHAQDVVRAVER